MAPKKKMLPAKVMAQAKPQAPVLVLSTNGLVHKSTLDQLKNGVMRAPDPILVVEGEHGLWGGGRWTSEELRSVLVQMVSEGPSLRAVLSSLAESAPPIPKYMTVHQWKAVYPEFKKNLQIADKLRGEMQAEAATELAVQALTDDSLDPRCVKNAVEQFRWSAAKLDRETFGEHRTLEVQQPMAGVSDKDLDQRIKALMADPQVRGVLSAQGFEVMDAEVVSVEPAT